MTSKERVRAALNHQTADRLPVDFGGTAVTGIHASIVEKLRQHFGIHREPVRVNEPYQFLGEIDNDLKEALGIDTESVPPRKTMFGFTNDGWREFRAPWGQIVLVPEQFRTTVDADGSLLIYPEGDTSVPPSGRMPSNGYFFDAIVRQEPFDEEHLNPEDNMEEFTPVSADDLEYFRRAVGKAAATGRAVVATFGGLAFGDIALVPGNWMKRTRGIRDIAEWYATTLTRQDYVHAVFEHQCRIALENLAEIHAVVGNAVDTLFICGTDFGTQTSQFCSLETFDELYAPYYRRVNDWIHAHTTWKTFKHSCGSVEVLVDRFIDCGFDILNPVQITAAGMEPKHLKEKYGEKIVFWGGGVDTQKTLPFGTPAQVRTEVLRLCETFGRNGGFIFNAIHNIQAHTPVENVVAMVEALKEYNG